MVDGLHRWARRLEYSHRAERVATTNYTYNTGNASPYTHEMASNESPDGGTTAIHYYTYGMVQNTVAPVGGMTSYTYTATNCASNTVSGCVAPGDQQTTMVTYPDGEIDGDEYLGALLVADAFGPSSTYDGSGDQAWTFNYNWSSTQFGNTTETINLPDSKTATVVTDAVGNVTSYTDPLGNVTNSMYNDTGGNYLEELCWTLPTGGVQPNASCNNPPPGSTYYTYDSYGHQLSETNPLGYTTWNGYYSNGLLCYTAEATVGDGTAQCGNAASGAPTGSTAYIYSEGNVIQTIVDFNGGSSAQETQTSYNSESEPTYSIPPDGVSAGAAGSNPYETAYQYQAYGRMTTETGPFSRTTNITYDPDGNVLTEADPAGVTTNTYDLDGRTCWTLRATSGSANACGSPPSGSTSYGYASSADTSAPTTVTDPNNHTTTYSYGNKQYPTKPTVTSDPMSSDITFDSYNTFGQVCLTGPGSSPSSCPTSASSTPAGDASTIISDDGQVLSTTDASGETTSYLYTDSEYPNNPTSMTNPLGKVTPYYYDADGNQVETSDPIGNVISTGYDADGRVCYVAPIASSASCSSAPTGVDVTVNSWNAANERTQMIDNHGATGQVTSTYTYDSDGNLLSSSDDNGRTVSYQYDDAAEVTCIAYPVLSGPNCSNAPNSTTNSVVDRACNSAGQLSSTTDWLGNTVQYGNYNQNSQVGLVTYPGPEALSYGYDPDGNLTSADYAGPTAGNNSWTYNADEEEVTTNQLGAFSSPSDTYNNYVQTTLASNPTAPSTSVADSYTNAANGEVQSDLPSGQSAISYSYNGGAELTSQTNPNLPSGSADTSYGYTNDGERCWSLVSSSITTDNCGSSAPTGSTETQWNAFKQLCYSGPVVSSAACASPPTGATTYTYDGNGLRMTETPPSGPTFKFSWDLVDGGSTPLDIDDGSFAYIYGNTLFGGTAPVEQINLSTKIATFLSAIPSGVQDVLSSTGTTLEQSAYSTYGKQVIEAGSVSTAFGFQGSYGDPSGLDYMIGRYYDPNADQFISVDPAVSQTGQPYAFTGDDPLNATDPMGLRFAGPPGTGDYCNTGSEGTWCHQQGETGTTQVLGPPRGTTGTGTGQDNGPGYDGYDGYDAQLTAFYAFLTAQANQRASVAAFNALVDGELKAAAEQKLQAENAAAEEVNNYMNQVSYPVRTAGVDASRLVDFGMSVADCLSEAKSDLGVGGYFGVGFWYVGQYIPYVDIGIDTGAAVGGTVAVGLGCGAHINAGDSVYGG